MVQDHRFSRIRLLVGAEGLQHLSGSSVAVFGVGGVGSYAVEALARSGVGRLTLIDFDDICLTNINRQIHALDETIGESKVDVMAERCRQINPAIEIEPVKDFFRADKSGLLLEKGYDYVLDCIDHITAKLELLELCVQKKIPVISSMGAANKLDPGKIEVADLAKTHKCRLARIVRKELRKRGIKKGIKVVYSTEEFRPLRDETSACNENCICPNRDEQVWSCEHRRVILGTSSYVPPLFGLTMAGEVINDLLEHAT